MWIHFVSCLFACSIVLDLMIWFLPPRKHLATRADLVFIIALCVAHWVFSLHTSTMTLTYTFAVHFISEGLPASVLMEIFKRGNSLLPGSWKHLSTLKRMTGPPPTHRPFLVQRVTWNKKGEEAWGMVFRIACRLSLCLSSTHKQSWPIQCDNKPSRFPALASHILNIYPIC